MWLDAYLDGIQAGVNLKRSVKRPAPIGTFLYTFFQQFFKAGWSFEIAAIDQTSKARATKTRLEADPKDEEVIGIISSFEELCDLWEDLLGFQYGGRSSEVLRFHDRYLPRLIRRISAWAQAKGYTTIAARADQASKRFDAAGE